MTASSVVLLQGNECLIIEDILLFGRLDVIQYYIGTGVNISDYIVEQCNTACQYGQLVIPKTEYPILH
jgi:hypothetical protein